MTRTEVKKRLREAVLIGGVDTLIDEARSIIEEMLVAADAKNDALAIARIAFACVPNSYLAKKPVMDALLAIEKARLL